VESVSVRVGRATLLDRVDVTIPAGRLVAVAGPSGAGKTTLLEVMAGLRKPAAGRVALGPAAGADTPPARVGVVPQDDIIHRDLPLGRTLLYAARLRLPPGEGAGASRVVQDVLRRLGLADRSAVPVSSLSGGQRKRASIAVELLTQPDTLFLDEPTSGLDPSSAAEVVDTLRSLTRQGMTVVMTTHHPVDIGRCDHVVFLDRGGRVRFAGRPSEAPTAFGVEDLAAVYPALGGTPARPVRHPAAAGPAGRAPTPSYRLGASSLRQWLVLTARGAEVMARNPLTLAIVLGSPALVIAMMAVLFPAGAFDDPGPIDMGPPQTAFWMAFSAFFFGLTYGLLQIVTERAVLRRERFAGLDLTAYLASKVALLLPILVAVVSGLLGVLRLLDRLPAEAPAAYGALLVTLTLTASAGLMIGLAASAAVADATQATLALPMICFPQVLFAGAVVPVGQMAGVGVGLSLAMTTRWSFESIGRTLLPVPPDPAAPSSPYHAAFSGSPVAGWVALGAVIAVAAMVALVALRARTARS
jgi:ABC-type multidrug transport system ATPase subunit